MVAGVREKLTGQLTVASSSAVDFETSPVFNLTVQAMDSGGTSSTGTVTVSLNDLNENPVINTNVPLNLNEGDLASIDNTTLRRGVPTVNHRWGSHPAILMGDYLFTKGFDLLSEHGLHAALSLLTSVFRLARSADSS